MTNDQQNLLNHLNGIKTKTEAWVAEDPSNRWAAYPVIDIDHWATNGITTIEQYEHYNLVCTAFEATRSALGYKPSWVGLDRMSDVDLKKEIDFLGEMIREQIEAEKREEKRHMEAVKKAMTHHSGWSIGELINN